MVTSLRAFLRFAHATGRTAVPLTGVVPVVASWRLSALPRGLPASEVEGLLAGCERRTPAGRMPGQPATLADLPVLSQVLVHRGDRADVDALVEQSGVDLRRSSVNELRAVQQPQNLLAFGQSERVRRHRPLAAPMGSAGAGPGQRWTGLSRSSPPRPGS